jgi:hypothetical protein
VTPGGNEAGKTCGEQAFTIERSIHDVLIVLDRSLSMSDSPSFGSANLWDQSRSAIYEVTGAMQSQIWFGLTVFPSSSGLGACSDWENSCAPPGDPIVPVGAGAAAAIKGALVGLETCGSTPTAQALAQARLYLQGKLPANGHARSILLATDGGPNCNSALNPWSCVCTMGGKCYDAEGCLDDQATYKALDELCAAGIKTYVVGMGASPSLSSVLASMAQRGCTGQPHAASDPASLKQAFQNITGGIASCAFDLDCAKVQDPWLVNFYFDGKVVARTPTKKSGWDWVAQCKAGAPGKGRVEFFGADCQAIKSSSVKQVSAKYGCATKID